MLSSSSVLSILFIGSRNRSPAATYLILAQCKISNLNFDERSWQRSNFPEGSDIVMSHFRVSWSVLIVHRQPSTYGWSGRISQITASRMLCVVTSLPSEPLSIRNQCPIGLSVSSSCVWSSMHPTCVPKTSVQMVNYTFVCGRTSTGGYISRFLSSSTDCVSASFRGVSIFGSSFRSILFNGFASLENPGTAPGHTL